MASAMPPDRAADRTQAAPLVLVVEDNAANLLLTSAVLRRDGFRVLEATSAEAAHERLGETRPDLILVDVGLPGQDGLSLTRQLRLDPRTATLPIVAVTAHAMAEDHERALQAGCDSYVTKPIDTRTLASQLRALLASRGGDPVASGAAPSAAPDARQPSQAESQEPHRDG